MKRNLIRREQRPTTATKSPNCVTLGADTLRHAPLEWRASVGHLSTFPTLAELCCYSLLGSTYDTLTDTRSWEMILLTIAIMLFIKFPAMAVMMSKALVRIAAAIELTTHYLSEAASHVDRILAVMIRIKTKIKKLRT